MSVTELGRRILHVFRGCAFCSGALQIAAGLANANAIVLAEAVEQLNALLEHAIPGIAMRVLELLILVPTFNTAGFFAVRPDEDGS